MDMDAQGLDGFSDTHKTLLWVGGIPESLADDELLRSALWELEGITSVTTCSKSGQNNSWAFMSMKTERSADKAMRRAVKVTDVYGDTCTLTIQRVTAALLETKGSESGAIHSIYNTHERKSTTATYTHRTKPVARTTSHTLKGMRMTSEDERNQKHGSGMKSPRTSRDIGGGRGGESLELRLNDMVAASGLDANDPHNTGATTPRAALPKVKMNEHGRLIQRVCKIMAKPAGSYTASDLDSLHRWSRTVPAFSAMRPDHLEEIVQSISLKRFMPGETIIDFGAPNRRCCMMLTGVAEARGYSTNVDSRGKIAGTLLVTIHSAKDLPNVDVKGSTDPFCAVTVHDGHAGAAIRTVRTKCRHNKLSPDWEEQFQFVVQRKEGAKLRFECWDECSSITTGPEDNEALGAGVLKLETLNLAHGVTRQIDVKITPPEYLTRASKRNPRAAQTPPEVSVSLTFFNRPGAMARVKSKLRTIAMLKSLTPAQQTLIGSSRSDRSPAVKTAQTRIGVPAATTPRASESSSRSASKSKTVRLPDIKKTPRQPAKKKSVSSSARRHEEPRTKGSRHKSSHSSRPSHKKYQAQKPLGKPSAYSSQAFRWAAQTSHMRFYNELDVFGFRSSFHTLLHLDPVSFEVRRGQPGVGEDLAGDADAPVPPPAGE